MRRVGHLRREPATRAHPPFSVKALAAEEATSPRRMARCTCPRASVGGSGECAHAPTVCAFGVGAVHKGDSAGFSLTPSNFHSAASTDEANSATANLATAAMVETPCRRLASTICDNARCMARVRKCTRCARSVTEPCVSTAHGVSPCPCSLVAHNHFHRQIMPAGGVWSRCKGQRPLRKAAAATSCLHGTVMDGRRRGETDLLR